MLCKQTVFVYVGAEAAAEGADAIVQFTCFLRSFRLKRVQTRSQ